MDFREDFTHKATNNQPSSNLFRQTATHQIVELLVIDLANRGRMPGRDITFVNQKQRIGLTTSALRQHQDPWFLLGIGSFGALDNPPHPIKNQARTIQNHSTLEDMTNRMPTDILDFGVKTLDLLARSKRGHLGFWFGTLTNKLGRQLANHVAIVKGSVDPVDFRLVTNNGLPVNKASCLLV